MEVIIVLVVVIGIIGCLLYFRSREASNIALAEEANAWLLHFRGREASKVTPAEEANAWPVTEPTVPVTTVRESVVETPTVVETVEQSEVVAKPKRTRTKKATVESTTAEQPKPATKPRAKKPKMTVAK